MKYFKRYLTDNILKDLKSKMVFIGGPRQVGKTSLAKYIIAKHFKRHSYFNWDYKEDRDDILNYRFNPDSKLLIFDEIHKYKNWKNHIKGIYDKYKGKYSIIITGSSRLDIYRKGGDSLLGRYYYYKLFPLTFAEVNKTNTQNYEPFKELKFSEEHNHLKELQQFGGFPEPFFSKDKITLNRWHNMRSERIIKEDIRDIKFIKDISNLQILVDSLEKKVASLFSIKSVSEDISSSYKTVAHWLDILEEFYYVFRIYPFKYSKIKSIKKMPKLYLYDWSEVKDLGAKTENLVAVHLLKFVNYLYDAFGYKTELFFLRDIEGREVDFLVTVDTKPWFSVEVKTSKKNISKNLYYFSSRENIPFNYQIVSDKETDFIKDNIRVISIDKFLSALV